MPFATAAAAAGSKRPGDLLRRWTRFTAVSGEHTHEEGSCLPYCGSSSLTALVPQVQLFGTLPILEHMSGHGGLVLLLYDAWWQCWRWCQALPWWQRRGECGRCSRLQPMHQCWVGMCRKCWVSMCRQCWVSMCRCACACAVAASAGGICLAPDQAGVLGKRPRRVLTHVWGETVPGIILGVGT